jgi:hypothetical protein
MSLHALRLTHSTIPLGASSAPAMLYFPYMKETDFEERFDRLEKHLENGAKQIDVLARATEREFRDLHHSINHRLSASVRDSKR